MFKINFFLFRLKSQIVMYMWHTLISLVIR